MAEKPQRNVQQQKPHKKCPTWANGTAIFHSAKHHPTQSNNNDGSGNGRENDYTPAAQFINGLI